MEIRSPETEEEFAAYYELRWRVLRKPWGQPSGSERDELDDAATHVAGYDEAKRLVCVGRLHPVETGVGQVRYMAVEEPLRGRGLGQAVLDELERLGQAAGHVGDPFWMRASRRLGSTSRNGYEAVGEGHVLFCELCGTAKCERSFQFPMP